MGRQIFIREVLFRLSLSDYRIENRNLGTIQILIVVDMLHMAGIHVEDLAVKDMVVKDMVVKDMVEFMATPLDDKSSLATYLHSLLS